jgi:hypothetical protein
MMAKFDVLPDCGRKQLLWLDKESLKDQITTRIMKIILIQILKRPQAINEEHQQDTDRRNRIIDRQIAKEIKNQRSILGISSIGTPQIRREVVQGQHWTYQQDH